MDVVFTTLSVVTDTVYIDMPAQGTYTLCLDEELDMYGNAIVSVDICQQPLYVMYDFAVNGDVVCFEFEPLDATAHQDTMCVITCDNSSCNVCDRTIIILTMHDSDEPPVATEECVEVEENGEITVQVLLNDIDPDGDILYVSGIIDGPSHGTATISGQGQSIVYIPKNDFCGTDTLYYVVCDLDNNGCDTAFVCITVLCDCFIPNALTPNNDGFNDYFIVECLEQIDGGELTVFNRWGNEVYHSDDYKNDWKGYYKGEPLPEGTYYYIIKFTDHDGILINKAGDLTILR
jgi:gliding motility-associated-like protein